VRPRTGGGGERRTRVAGCTLRACSIREAERTINSRGDVHVPTWVGVLLAVGLPLVILLVAVFAS
jgi:hypothetical protein